MSAEHAAIPLEDQLKAARRELHMRVRVYPRLVSQEKMSQQAANHELAAMKAICETLQRLIDIEGQQPSLFGGET